MKLWSWLVYISLFYEVWAITFRMAFSDPSLTSTEFNLDVTTDTILCVDVFVRVCEYLDAALKQNADPVMEKKIIMDVIQYSMRSDLLQNLLCIVPFYAASAPISNLMPISQKEAIDIHITYYHWIWWLSTIPRGIIRTYRLYEVHSLASTDLTSNIHTEDWKNIGVFIVLSAHCIGCFYFFMSRLRGLDSRSWVFSTEQTLNVYHRFEGKQWEQYLLALFKGFSAISGIEFDPYLPNNLEEQLVGISMILVQTYISALILGTIIHFLGLRDPLAQQAAERLRDLREFADLHQLPAELEARLLAGLEFQHQKLVCDDADAEVELSQSLQLKVVQSKYGALLQRGRAKGQAFHGCSDRFLSELLVELNVVYLMAGQDVVKKGDIAQELIIIVDGSADVLNDRGESTSTVSSSSPDSFPTVGEVRLPTCISLQNSPRFFYSSAHNFLYDPSFFPCSASLCYFLGAYSHPSVSLEDFCLIFFGPQCI
jgi:hypothetical protein